MNTSNMSSSFPYDISFRWSGGGGGGAVLTVNITVWRIKLILYFEFLRLPVKEEQYVLRNENPHYWRIQMEYGLHIKHVHITPESDKSKLYRK